MRFFVTGTDTDVGKTRVACALVRQFGAVGLKPICCGGREDAEALRAAAQNVLTLDEVNPIHFAMPAAPAAAAAKEGAALSLSPLVAAVRVVQARFPSIIVEGVGGWLVPLAPGVLASDLAVQLRLAVLVVAADRLGAINHILLTIRAIQADGLECVGVILNQPAPLEIPYFEDPLNRAALLAALPVPLLGTMRHGSDTIQWTDAAHGALNN